MAQSYFKGGPIFSGPNSSAYIVIKINAAAQNAEVLWKEGQYYYIELSNEKIQGYVPSNFVNAVSVPSYNPTNTTRYVAEEGAAYWGDNTTFLRATAPEYGQAVRYLGKKVGSLAFIEYPVSSTPKRRAWFPHMSLAVSKPYTPGNYADYNIIDSTGDVWRTPTNGWAHDLNENRKGHLGLDIHRCNSNGVSQGNSARGKSVYAIADGTVVAHSDSDTGNGRCLVIKHTTSNGNDFYSTYCHLNSRAVSSGAAGKKHQIIGTMGNSGNAAVVHIHLHITEDNAGVNAYGYYRDGNDNTASFTNQNYLDFNGTRYFNPTKFFAQGESFIDDYHS